MQPTETCLSILSPPIENTSAYVTHQLLKHPQPPTQLTSCPTSYHLHIIKSNWSRFIEPKVCFSAFRSQSKTYHVRCRARDVRPQLQCPVRGIAAPGLLPATVTSCHTSTPTTAGRRTVLVSGAQQSFPW